MRTTALVIIGSSSTARIRSGGSAPPGPAESGDGSAGTNVSTSGNVVRNVVPVPSAEVTSMRPPCWSTIPNTIARPRPVPPSPLVVKNSLNTRARTSALMPTPESTTSTTPCPSSATTRRRIVPPIGSASTALKMRLVISSRSCAGEPWIVGWPAASTCRLIGRPSACAASRQRGAVSWAASRTTVLRSTRLLFSSGAARVKQEQPFDGLTPVQGGLGGGRQQVVELPQVRGILLHRSPRQVAVAGHQHQRLVEIVRDAGGHLAQRAQLLRLRHPLALLLGPPGFGDVLGVNHHRLGRHEHVAERQFALDPRGPIPVSHLAPESAVLRQTHLQIGQDLRRVRIPD